MSTIADITDIMYMGRKIERIMYMGRELTVPPFIRPKLVGSKKLKDGTMEAGFFGEVAQRELIDAKTLVDMCFTNSKISSSIILNKNTTWLKFAYMNKVEYIAKQPLCDSIKLEHLSPDNLIDGSRIITIDGIRYRIRLIKGKTEGKQSDTSSTKGSINHYSEWNRLILPLVINRNESNYKYPDNVEPDRLKWTGRYLEDDFSFFNDKFRFKKLSGAICQDGLNWKKVLIRGADTIESSQYMGVNQATLRAGWRPVLEVVDF